MQIQIKFFFVNLIIFWYPVESSPIIVDHNEAPRVFVAAAMTSLELPGIVPP